MPCCCEPKDDYDEPRETNDKPQRGCTDIPFLVLFILFWCGMILIGSFSIVQGDPWRLVYGSDTFGNTCGVENSRVVSRYNGTDNLGLNLAERPYLFSMSVSKPYQSVWICVKQCPMHHIGTEKELKRSAKSGLSYCFYDFDYERQNEPNELINTMFGPCPELPVYNSKVVLNRCIPESSIKAFGSLFNIVFGFLNDIDLFEQVLSDLMTCWRTMLLLCGLAFIVSLIFVFLIRFIAGVVIYIFFGIIAIVGLAVCGVLWYCYVSVKFELDQNNALYNFTQNLISDTKNEHTLLIFSIACTVVSVFFLVMIGCIWSHVSDVVSLFQEAGKCLASMPCLLLQPIWTFLILIIFIAYWTVVVLMLATASPPTIEHVMPTKVSEMYMVNNKTAQMGALNLDFVKFDTNYVVKYMWWFHLIGLIWTSEFILACQQLVVAGAVANWYFYRKKDGFRFPMCESLKNLIVFHLGSVAFGAFILTIVKLPRLILMYMQQKMKASESKCAKCCMRCCVGCLWCIEKCIRYLHHNAYTIIAIEGRSFCPAAKQAFETLASHIIDVGLINSAGDIVLFLGKCGVTAVVTLIGLFMFRSNERLHFYAMPLLLVCVFTFFVAHCFFSVYEMLIDTLFLCFCEDENMRARNDVDHADLAGPKSFSLFVDKSTRRGRHRRPVPTGIQDPESMEMTHPRTLQTTAL